MDDSAFRVKVEGALKQGIRARHALASGMISQVLRVELENGESLVAKVGDGGHDLTIEAFMLRYLRERTALPAPDLLHAEPSLLLMEYVPGRIEWEGEALRHLGELLAGCHQITSATYGLERDTLNGPLRQPNPQTESWIAFFREQRLRYMIGVARETGHLPAELEIRLLRIAERVEGFLIEPALARADSRRYVAYQYVIVRDGRIAGIIDPALYYAHNEMELAYMALFRWNWARTSSPPTMAAISADRPGHFIPVAPPHLQPVSAAGAPDHFRPEVHIRNAR